MSRRLLGAFVAVSLVLAGCGVPGGSDPKRVGTPQRAAQADQKADEPPKNPDGALSADVLLLRYLQASAWGNTTGGDRPNGSTQAIERVKEFLTSDAGDAWEPTADQASADFKLYKVSYPSVTTAGAYTIAATIQQVGTLTELGAVDPVSSLPTRYDFRIVDVGGGQLRIANPLPGMVFDVTRLSIWYKQRTIYFWDVAGRSLVPDVRYMPTGVDPAKRPNEIARWLQEGPSRWLGNAVRQVPDDIEVQGNIVPESRAGGTTLPINLTAKAASLGNGQSEGRAQALTDYLVQVRWSLRESADFADQPVELEIEGTTQRLPVTEQEFRAANPAVWPESLTDPETYAIFGGKLRSQAGPAVPLLDAAHNQNMLSASITRAKTAVAYVVKEGGRQRLWLATAGPNAEAEPNVRPVYVLAANLSRPVWLDGQGRRLLVAADGNLAMVTLADGVETAPATLVPTNVPGAVTAVAPAPDGRRLAFIAGGRAYVAAVRVEGSGLTVQQPRELMTDLAEQLAIDWATQDRVVIGGRSTAGSPLVEVAVDGTEVKPVEKDGLGPVLRVTRIAAYPDSPIVVDQDRPASTTRRLMLLEAGDAGSFNVFSGEIKQIQQPPSPAPSPSVSVAPTSGPPLLASAPFFLD